ncbi:uncharacterized protein LOC111613080 [Centruroides sculpturatus]|uniref:uncharacterized protein LOC111613080 n=1 Tax=Centruroides sculpturatus TaxID=218467 RepID=UPI000C6D67C9|nr:uncharacterized protein LOC111613080 [Centruroides sculpturatus]
MVQFLYLFFIAVIPGIYSQPTRFAGNSREDRAGNETMIIVPKSSTFLPNEQEVVYKGLLDECKNSESNTDVECPQTCVNNIDENRIPRLLVNIKCQTSTCHSVVYTFPVFYKVKETINFTYYVQHSEEVHVGCVKMEETRYTPVYETRSP